MKKNILTYVLTAFMTMLWTTNAQADKFGISIGGVEITTDNYTDITAANGFQAITGGTVTYDPDTKTLTLSNVTIEQPDRPAIKNEGVDGLTIVCIGENKLSCETLASFMISKGSATTLIGGKFTCISTKDCGIFVSDSHLTIQDCEITATGQWGIAGYNVDSSDHLTINNSTVRAKGDGNQGSICDFLTVTLNNCKISSPEGAAFDEKLYGIVKDGALVKEEIIITPESTGIGSVSSEDTSDANTIYSLDGRKLGTPQRGVNIIKKDNKTQKVIF